MTAIKRLIKGSIQAAGEPKANIGALEIHRYRDDDEYSSDNDDEYLTNRCVLRSAARGVMSLYTNIQGSVAPVITSLSQEYICR